MLYFYITFIKEWVIMNRRIEKKAEDELIIVRLRCKFLIKCDRYCNRKAMDIIIKEGDLASEGHRRHKKVNFQSTLLNTCERLGIDMERVFCDKHKGVTNENFYTAINTNVFNDTGKNIS